MRLYSFAAATIDETHLDSPRKIHTGMRKYISIDIRKNRGESWGVYPAFAYIVRLDFPRPTVLILRQPA